jgi:uncharacterized protein (DUF433 family)
VRLLKLRCMHGLKNMVPSPCLFGDFESHGAVRKPGGFMLGFDRITFDPHVMGGRACIRGMRITVSLLMNLVANGMTNDEIIDAYPYLEPEDIHQALHYVAWLAEETVHPLEPVQP